MIKVTRSNFFTLQKIIFSNFAIMLALIFGCKQQPQKEPFKAQISTKKASIKAKVNHWPTDTIYFATFTFHSPYSTTEGFKLLASDQTFEYTFDQVDKPFIIFLTPERKFLDLRNDVLFENLTDKYYRGYCQKFYDYPITTYLIEPGTETKVVLTKKKRYGKTQIEFLNTNRYNSVYYQTTFELDQKFDEVLDSRFEASLNELKNVDHAISNLNTKLKELSLKLAEEQPYISPFLYQYTKAELQFGAKKEFLRYLLLDHKEEASKLFKHEIAVQINNIVEFNKEDINYATLISQEYNEFIELYLLYKWSKLKHQLITYKEFDEEKFDFALVELPQASRYYYLANHLLHLGHTQHTKKLVTKLMERYPDGQLNDKLTKKYN